MQKRFTVINEGFRCFKCGFENDRAAKTCRNHCKSCLYSLHVDKEFPGDRSSGCGGLMEPSLLDYSGKKGYLIVHRCTVCGKRTRNKCAVDDAQESLQKLVDLSSHGLSDS